MRAWIMASYACWKDAGRQLLARWLCQPALCLWGSATHLALDDKAFVEMHTIPPLLDMGGRDVVRDREFLHEVPVKGASFVSALSDLKSGKGTDRFKRRAKRNSHDDECGRPADAIVIVHEHLSSVPRGAIDKADELGHDADEILLKAIADVKDGILELVGEARLEKGRLDVGSHNDDRRDAQCVQWGQVAAAVGWTEIECLGKDLLALPAHLVAPAEA